MDGRSRLWDGYYERERFSSSRHTGKWMFRMDPAGSGEAMERLYDAVGDGAIPATKRSTPTLEAMMGGKALLIAYVNDKSPAAASAALSVLRGYGLVGPASFKDDMATMHDNDDIAYLDVDFETGGALSSDGVLAEGAVLRLDDCTYIEAWMTGHGPDGAPRGVGHRLQAWGKGGFMEEDLWLDPEIRLPRRMNLLRIDFDRVVHVIGSDWGPSAPRAPGREG